MSFSGTKGWNTKPKPGVMLNPLHPLSQGLVGYWLFNEGAGSRATDISGHGNHGALKNMAPNAQGSGWGGSKFGGGLHFDAVDDYVDCGNIFENFRQDRTFSAWVYLNDITSDNAIMGKFANVVNKDDWLIYFDDVGSQTANTDIFAYVIPTAATGDSWLWIESSTGMQTHTWYHVCVVHQWGVDARIYINGVDDTQWSQAVTGTVGAGSTQNFLIGEVPSGGKDFNGIIDSVHIYNRALSAAEVKQLYHDPFCNLLRVPIRRYSVAAPPVGATMNQFQTVNLGADLYQGAIIA